MGRAGRAIVIGLIVVAAAFVTSATAHSGVPDTPDCPARAEVAHLGLACRGSDGLLWLFGADGAFLGTTHGADEVPDAGEPNVAAASSIPPACIVNPTSTDYYAKVIYTRPNDVADGYATKKATIVAAVNLANGYVQDAAAATGGAAAIKVECDASGAVIVYNTVLAHNRASSNSFNNVVTDLKNLGHNNPRAKHWVFVDGGSSNICSCGVGHIYGDDSLSISNANNGGTGFAMYAVTWVLSSAHIALHELGHNMGAVQDSAPHSSLAGHCNDGLDTMCYQDGGSAQCTSGFSCPGTCSTEVFDCGKNDYFHRNPAAGSYLATHWNLGNPLNRFLAFGIPTIQSFTCTSPIGIAQPATCAVRATDTGNLRYTIAWGDASATCIPSCSTFVAQNVTQTATHSYATGGVMSVNATAYGSTGQASGTASVTVLVDATPPTTMLVNDSSPSAASDPTINPRWYNGNYRFALSASDTGGTGVAGMYYRIDGGPIQRYASIASISTSGFHTIVYNSTDVGGNIEAPKSASVAIDKVAPTASAPLASCNPCVSTISLSGSASDALSRLYALRIEWASPVDGALSGSVCDNPAVAGQASGSTSCTFTGFSGLLPGQYCFRTAATDRAGNVARSDPTCVVFV